MNILSANSEQWRVEIADIRLPALLKTQQDVDDLHCRLMTAERDHKWAEARWWMEGQNAYKDTQAAVDGVRTELAEAKRALTQAEHLLRLSHELLRLEMAYYEAQHSPSAPYTTTATTGQPTT